jgi:hypothetical protein
LENKSYCISNVQLSKEEFLAKREEILRNKALFVAKKLATFAKMGNGNSTASRGASIINSDHIESGYFVSYGKNSRNVILFEGGNTGTSEIYDSIDV